MVLTAIIASTFVISGCGGGGGGGSSGGSSGGSGSPEISLSTSALDFGNVAFNAAGLRSADRSVQVTNTGTGNLSIGQIAAANPLALPFSIFDDNCSNTSLASGASCSVVVRFKPTQPQDNLSDSFDIPSNDADEASLTVNVGGNAKGLNVTINKVDTTTSTIRMIVSVTDGNNEPQTNLDLLPSAFTVFEGATQKLPIVTKIAVTDPISVDLDLDYSASILPFKQDVQDSALGFLAKLTNPNDEATATKFARELIDVIPFTNNVASSIAAFEAAINSTANNPPTLNATRLFDAVDGSINGLEPRANDRLVALVVSDGVDFDRTTGGLGSTQNLENVIANAKLGKVFIFTIGLGSPIDTVVMQRMAVETGGQYFEAANSSDLGPIYDKIFLILSNQYAITFDTLQPDGSSNSLRVVADNGSLDGEDTKTVIY
jgi:Ca-activated chloride channel family protein